MTRQRSVDGDVGGLGVTNLSDHDDVGCLTEHGAQSVRERHPDVGFHHDLVDAGHFILDGVFYRDDFLVGTVNDVEAAIKRGGFTGTSWPRDEQNAIGQSKESLEGGLVVREESEFGQAENQSGFVKNTHNDRFAVVGGNRGNPQVDFFAADFDLNPSVLRHPFLGDAHAGTHDLKTSDDRR